MTFSNWYTEQIQYQIKYVSQCKGKSRTLFTQFEIPTFDKRQSRCDINLMKITLSGPAIKQEALVVHGGATINPALDTVRIGLILIVRRTKCEIKDCRDCGCSTFYVRESLRKFGLVKFITHEIDRDRVW